MEELATSSNIHQQKSRRWIEHQPLSTSPRPRSLSASLPWSTIVRDAETGESLEIRPRRWELPLPRPGDNVDKNRTEMPAYVPWRSQSNKRFDGNAGEDAECQSPRYPNGDEGLLLESGTPTARERIWRDDKPGDEEGREADVDVDEWGGYMNILARIRDFEIGSPDEIISNHTLLANEEKEHEPDTPRPTEPLHSPVWIPAPRECALLDHASKVPKQTAWTISPGEEPRLRYRSGYERGDSSGNGDGRSRSVVTVSPKQQKATSLTRLLRPENGQNVPRDRESVEPSVERPSSSADVAPPGGRTLRKVGATPKHEYGRKTPLVEPTTSGLTGETVLLNVVPSDVRHNIYRVQETRDRYLRQILDMLMEEAREEHRREAALRIVAAHPLRYKGEVVGWLVRA